MGWNGGRDRYRVCNQPGCGFWAWARKAGDSCDVCGGAWFSQAAGGGAASRSGDSECSAGKESTESANGASVKGQQQRQQQQPKNVGSKPAAKAKAGGGKGKGQPKKQPELADLVAGFAAALGVDEAVLKERLQGLAADPLQQMEPPPPDAPAEMRNRALAAWTEIGAARSAATKAAGALRREEWALEALEAKATAAKEAKATAQKAAEEAKRRLATAQATHSRIQDEMQALEESDEAEEFPSQDHIAALEVDRDAAEARQRKLEKKLHAAKAKAEVHAQQAERKAAAGHRPGDSETEHAAAQQAREGEEPRAKRPSLLQGKASDTAAPMDVGPPPDWPDGDGVFAFRGQGSNEGCFDFNFDDGFPPVGGEAGETFRSP